MRTRARVSTKSTTVCARFALDDDLAEKSELARMFLEMGIDGSGVQCVNFCGSVACANGDSFLACELRVNYA